MANFLIETLPIPVALAPGSTESLPTILAQAFGPNLGGYEPFWVAYYSAAQLQTIDGSRSYWNPSSPVDAKWLINGVDIGAGFNNQTFVPLNQIGTASFDAGNDIGPFAYVTVPIAGAAGNWTEYIQYSIITVPSSLMSATASNGDPIPADIVAAAQRFAATYVNVPNNSDCDAIASAVAAAAGATFDEDVAENTTNPSLNQEFGFWRIVYRGSDPNPVANWQTLVQPGDIVRMAWQNGGFHTTTVLAVNPDGSLRVYDNSDFVNGAYVIGIHDNVHYD
jgi:hypothetical protein